ncbi:hypothetical protein HPP92_013153 [Vanilla planifolia]|uniref:EngC GTPase domain-containing protein n=1 Tax=Vanilla planifolia TaxID=51239 RepID=A0A835UWH5_VANPL|nr:hypothetical protein HPP92_013153 [Vanilla planifolia]
MIEDVFERKTEVADPPVANVDNFLVLFSMVQPNVEPLILTRFLVEAESTGIPVTLALNKCDLAEVATDGVKWLEIRELGSVQKGVVMKTYNSACLFFHLLGRMPCEGDWERFPYYLQLLDEIKIREEVQLRTFGTKREGDVRYKVGTMGIKQPEPRLELKKHRRVSRKQLNQTMLDQLEEIDDDWD